MSAIGPPPIYDDLLDLFVAAADSERLLTFRLPPDKQRRLDDLLQRNRDGLLTEADRGELEEFQRLEHLGRMLKARLRQKQQP